MQNGSAAVTKADLDALEQPLGGKLNQSEHQMDGKLDAVEQRLEGKLDASEQRILDTVGSLIRNSETRLLQAFYGFAEATNKRFNHVDGNIAASSK
jgi:hypothetical protein